MKPFVFYFHDEKNEILLEKKLKWFKSHFKILNYQEFINGFYKNSLPNNSCLLTVDDGWLSTYEIVYPLLKKYNIPITIFVSPYITYTEENFWYYEIKNCEAGKFKSFLTNNHYYRKGIEKFEIELLLKQININELTHLIKQYKEENSIPFLDRGFLNLKELLELSESGLVEIGAHTMHHPILALESYEISKKEISKSIEELSVILKKKITAFAYPNGLYGIDYGIREVEIVKEMGIKTAFSVNPGFIKSKTDPLMIPRLGSIQRLKIPYIGPYLPSLYNQESKRNQIKRFKL